MSIVMEMQVPPWLMRKQSFWTELEKLAGSRRLKFNESYSHVEHVHIITATSLDDPTHVGVATIQDGEWRFSYDRDKREELILEAIRFAAWQLVHNEETEEDEDGEEG